MTKAYEVLGVDANADEATIRAAFRRAVKTYHPDLNGGDPTAERRLRRLIAARAIITNSRRRVLNRNRPEHQRRILRAPVPGRSLVAVGTVTATTLLLLFFMSQHRGSARTIGPFKTTTVYLKNHPTSVSNSGWTTALRDLRETLRSGHMNGADHIAIRGRADLRMP